MPWLEFVTVKTATSASSAALRPVEEVHAEMQGAAARAIGNRAAARAMTLTTPIDAAVRVVAPASLAMLDGVPGIDYADDTVRFVATDYQAAYDGAIELITVARGGYPRVLVETVRTLEEGDKLMLDYSNALFARWLDFESGRWPPEGPPLEGQGQSGDASRRYHGAS